MTHRREYYPPMGGRHSSGSVVAGAWREWRKDTSMPDLVWQVPLVIVAVIVIWYAVGLSLLTLFWLIGLLFGH